MLLLDRPASEVLHTELTLEEYLALPEDTRCEIIDGVLRPMTRSGKRHRTVQRRLANALESRAPDGLLVAEEEVVIFKAVPPSTRIPDISVYDDAVVVDPDSNSVPVTGMTLVVEVVSPGSETEDRYHKPGDYARNGIAHFWRIEMTPDIEVVTYELVNGVYHETGVFRRGDRIAVESLPWVDVDVTDLLGPFA